jgi:hypothetical protein
MIYGLVEKHRTTRHSDTDYYWTIDRSDTEDREEIDTMYEPNNSLFWYFPEELTDEEVIKKMLKKMREEIHWQLHLYKLSEKAAKRYLKYGNTKSDYSRKTKYIESDKICRNFENDK